MRKPVRQRLTACLEEATKSERSIASYMLANLTNLPFETAGARQTGQQVRRESFNRAVRTTEEKGGV